MVIFSLTGGMFYLQIILGTYWAHMRMFLHDLGWETFENSDIYCYNM